MKKSWAILLSTLLTISLGVGCSNTQTTQQTETNQKLEQAEVSEASETAPAEEKEKEANEMEDVSAHTEAKTIVFTDSCGREVEIPAHIQKVAPSGSVAQMILYAVAPEKLACWAGKLGDEQKYYIEDDCEALPVTGQFYGKGDLNMEALIEAAPDVIIDLGDKKKSAKEDLDNIQEQTGIPTIFIEATVDSYAEMFRTLGKLLENEEQGEKLAAYTENVYQDGEKARAQIGEEDKLRVMFGTGETGLDCNAKGSIHCGVLEAVGVENAIEVAELSNKGGGNTVTMEEVIAADPDVILFEAGGPYEKVKDDAYWSGLNAIAKDQFYEIPYGPYHFLASPPSINQIIGIKWLGNLLYPELYPYDMVKELQEFYKLFWHYDLSEDEAKALLAHSTYKE